MYKDIIIWKDKKRTILDLPFSNTTYILSPVDISVITRRNYK